MKYKKTWKYIQLISKGIFHYTDLISDLMIINLYYYKTESFKNIKFSLNFTFLIFMLFLERYHTYKYFHYAGQNLK